MEEVGGQRVYLSPLVASRHGRGWLEGEKRGKREEKGERKGMEEERRRERVEEENSRGVDDVWVLSKGRM